MLTLNHRRATTTATASDHAWAALEISFRGAEQGRDEGKGGGKHKMGRTLDLS